MTGEAYEPRLHISKFLAVKEFDLDAKTATVCPAITIRLSVYEAEIVKGEKLLKEKEVRNKTFFVDGNESTIVFDTKKLPTQAELLATFTFKDGDLSDIIAAFTEESKSYLGERLDHLNVTWN